VITAAIAYVWPARLKLVQAIRDVLPAMQREHRAVGARRAVERELTPYDLSLLDNVLLEVTDGDGTRGRRVRPPRRVGPPRRRPWRPSGGDHLAGRYRSECSGMRVQAVGDLTGKARPCGH